MDGLLAAVHSIHEIRTQSYSGEDIVYLQRTTDQLHLLHPYTKPTITSSNSLFFCSHAITREERLASTYY